MRRFIILAAVAIAVFASPQESHTLSQSISINEQLTGRIPLNESRPCHILRFAVGTRELDKVISGKRLSVIAIMPPHNSAEAEHFVNRTALAARILEQQYRYGKIQFVLTDPQAHNGGFQPSEYLLRTLNSHLTKKIKASDYDQDRLRQDHHQFQMELHDREHARARALRAAGQRADSNGEKTFFDKLQVDTYPLYVIAVGNEPKEIWNGQTTIPTDLAARVASIANGKLRIMSAPQIASYALRTPVESTIIVKHTSKTSQPLRIALAHFAQIIAGDEDFFDGKVGQGKFLVLTREYILGDYPLPHGTRIRNLADFFPFHIVDVMVSYQMVLVEVDSVEGGKESYTFTKALRKHSISASKSKSKSRSLSVEADESGSSLSEADLVPPRIDSDVSLGMECLKVISRLVVSSTEHLRATTMQAVYARAPCIVIAVHGEGLFGYANISSTLRKECTFLYSDASDQKTIASFGFNLTELGDSSQLLIGVHYNHGKYATRAQMKIVEESQTDSFTKRAKDQAETISERQSAEVPATGESVDGDLTKFVDDNEDDDLYQPKHSRSNAPPKRPTRDENSGEDGDNDEQEKGSHHVRATLYDVKGVAHTLVPFVSSVLAGEAPLYEKTQYFEGETSDPAAIVQGEFFTDFIDSDDLHVRLLSDFTRDSFIAVFPPQCDGGCEDELRLMSTVVGNLDKYRETEAFRSLAIAFYNLTLNDLHKHLDPQLSKRHEGTLIFLERMKKFDFFMHNHARYSQARVKGGMKFEGHSEDGVIESKILSLKGKGVNDVHDFIKQNCEGSQYFLRNIEGNLESLEYDEL